jgi:uncharacterized protein YdaU (DUF1376 family)
VHLSNEEDICFRRLLDYYYDTEAPIPKETEWVSRRLRVGYDAVMTVLSEFFIETENGWKHARCDEEIAAYRALSEQARINGKLGGRPKKTKRKPDGNRMATEPKANQEPITSNQEPLKDNSLRESSSPTAKTIPPCPVQKILDTYHRVLPTLTRVVAMNDTRRKMLSTRWRELYEAGDFETQDGGVETFESYFLMVKDSQFLMGKANGANGRKPFMADFEWLIRPQNFLKVIEGKYHGNA